MTISRFQFVYYGNDLAMPIQADEEGVATGLQRIAGEFALQRDSLRDGSARFADWQAAWQSRQAAIDESLEYLKRRLSHRMASAPASLKLMDAE